MSKKKNKKFKKSSAVIKPSVLNAQDNIVEKQSETQKNNITSSVTAEKNNDPYAISILNERYIPVRRDVRKLLIVLSILAIILVGTYFVGLKTNILSAIGDWLYKIGNFAV